MMPGHAIGSFQEKMTTEDNIVQPAHQQKMIDDFKSVSRSSVDVVEFASGHCPMVSFVDQTTEVIMNAAGRA